MRDNDLLNTFRRHYDAPDANNEAVLAETEARFILEPWAERKVFVEALETAMLDYEIGVRERAERLSLHRHFRQIHERLKNAGR